MTFYILFFILIIVVAVILEYFRLEQEEMKAKLYTFHELLLELTDKVEENSK